MSLYFGSGDLYACGQLVSRFYRIRNSCYLYRIADAVNVFDLSDELLIHIIIGLCTGCYNNGVCREGLTTFLILDDNTFLGYLDDLCLLEHLGAELLGTCDDRPAAAGVDVGSKLFAHLDDSNVVDTVVEQLLELLIRLGLIDHHESQFIGCKSADLSDVHCDLDADITAADDNYVLAELCGAFKYIPCMNDGNTGVSGDRGDRCLGAACKNNAVVVLACCDYILCRRFLVEDDLNAELAAGATVRSSGYRSGAEELLHTATGRWYGCAFPK